MKEHENCFMHEQVTQLGNVSESNPELVELSADKKFVDFVPDKFLQQRETKCWCKKQTWRHFSKRDEFKTVDEVECSAQATRV